MITVYDPKETNFTHNGYGVISATLANITEELNGMFELELICPIGDINSRILDYLTETYIVKAAAPRGYQLFRIYAVQKKLNNEIKINARHIFYDLMFSIINNVKHDNITADSAIKAIISGAYPGATFTASSNIDISKRINIEFTDTNSISAILGEKGLISFFGGELNRDNFSVQLLSSPDTNRGFYIRYRKNLTGLDVEINTDDMVTRIKPIAQTSEGGPLYLPEIYIDSPSVNNYFRPISKIMEMRDIRVGSEETPNNNSAYNQMRARVSSFYSNGGDKPDINAKVDFILFKDTVAYKEFAPLENIFLGDYVTILHDGLNINLQAKCIKYVYDSILGRYKNIELGDFRDDFAISVSTDINQLSGKGLSLNTDERLILLNNQMLLLNEMLTNHIHNEKDGTKKISYNDIINVPAIV